MNDAYQAFLEKPNRDTYCRARQAVTAHPCFELHSLELVELSELCATDEFEKARELADEVWPVWCLSPHFHLLSGLIAEQLADMDQIELSKFQFQTCIDSLLATGRGSSSSPYQVTRIADEYDILRALGATAYGQRVIENGRKCFDVITCEDGREVWFDFGSALPSLSVRELTRRQIKQIPNPVVL